MNYFHGDEYVLSFLPIVAASNSQFTEMSNFPISFSVRTSLKGIMTRPDLSSMVLPPTMSRTSCVRCSIFGLHCSSLPNRGKHVCHQCDAAGDLDCIFSPAIRYTSTHVNTSCVCCIIHHKKCTFENKNDVKCKRCQERKTLCRFRMSGKAVILIHIT